jgi:hypothetical protein
MFTDVYGSQGLEAVNQSGFFSREIIMQFGIIHEVSEVRNRNNITCFLFHTRITIVTCFSDYRRGFGLDDGIYCALYIHNSESQIIQRYR